MANEQNNQTQNASTGSTENQFTSGSTASGERSQDSFSTAYNQEGSADLNVESAKETAKGLYDQAKNTAGQAYGAATKRATEVLEEKKVDLAGGLTSVADSIKQVGENLGKTEEQNKITETAAKYTNNLAQQIEQISGYFERKEVREMVRDVENFARRYPAYFIGGAFALGFLAARFLKSSHPKQLTEGAGQTFKNAEHSFDDNFGNIESQTATNPS